MTRKQKNASVTAYDKQYPPKEFVSSCGTISYRRVGSGKQTLVLLHGNPTWSFLYRNMLPYLKGYTVMVPDLLGYGYSYKPQLKHELMLQLQVAALQELLAYEKVKNPVFVGQDWGGPLATLLAEVYGSKKLVLMNTYLPGTLPFFGGLRAFLATRTAKFLIVYCDLFRYFAFRKGFYIKPSKEVRNAYRLPHKTRQQRLAVWALPAQLDDLRSSTVVLQKIDNYIVNEVSDLLVIWGMHDPVFNYKQVKRAVKILQHATFVPIQAAGHYLQEDAPKAVAKSITTWLT